MESLSMLCNNCTHKSEKMTTNWIHGLLFTSYVLTKIMIAWYHPFMQKPLWQVYNKSIIFIVIRIVQWPLTYNHYGSILWVWKYQIAIPTKDICAIEVCSGSDSCSWCDGSSRYHLCDSKLKWGVWWHPIQVRWSETTWSNSKRWNLPPMRKRRNCTRECHTLSRTWPLHTGQQLSTWNWEWKFQTSCTFGELLHVCIGS